MTNNSSKNNFEKAIIQVFSLDLRSLALFRICIGIFIIGDLAYRAIDLKAHYTDAGILPAKLAKLYLGDVFFSLHCLDGSTWFQVLLFLLAAFFALLMILGFNTRIVTVISWLFLISLINRNTVILNIGDYILKLSLFWSMFLPLGARYSIDSYLANVPKEKKKIVTSFSSASYMIQVAIFFLFAGLLKLKNKDWVDGNALFFVLNQVQYTTQFGYWLSTLPFDVLNKLSRFALALELYGPILFFVPYRSALFRSIGIGSFLLLLVSFALCLDLENVHWITAISLLALIPSDVWDLYISKLNLNFIDQIKISVRTHIEKYKNFYQKTNFKLNGIKPSIYGNILAVFFIVYVVQWNLISIDKNYAFPKEYMILGKIFRIDQRWGMFIPSNKDETWYGAWSTVVGYKKSREPIDLMEPDKKPSFKKPAIPANSYKNYHWRRILSKNGADNDKYLFPYVSSYFCKNWNENHPNDKIEEVEYYFNYYIPELNREQILPQRMIVWRRLCLSNEVASNNVINSIKNEPKILYLLPEAEIAKNILVQQKYKDATIQYKNIFYEARDKVAPESEAYINLLKMLYRLYFATNKSEEFVWIKTSLDDITGNYVEGYYGDESADNCGGERDQGCFEDYNCEGNEGCIE